ncbi:probable polygalacturonase At1g80170 [Selaginella moellendorffii]|uniref:probable polygalacturonase At1g80170 n=1 Tax=Selaginella moellendorffii TaxID=88036 RepID=UPI000D1D01FC|nr:probable polygalacturonase At1g80170 [Selaginella moellendorffii]|eukprot:XP_024543067.1 probable polygalacturonase At1g80170 [Selaginella moellendorffii]
MSMARLSLSLLMIILFWTLSRCAELEQWNILRPRPHPPRRINYTFYNVLDYGALSDGVSDDSEAFLAAWSAACESNYSVMVIPENGTYLLQPTVFPGPCGLGMKVQLDGVLVAPGFFDWNSTNRRQWLRFQHLDGFTLEGTGTIDGQGESWWEQSCKRNHSNPCHPAPEALTIKSCNSTTVRNLHFVNSQQMHLVFDTGVNIRAIGLNISAPQKSPNTDGIHLHDVQSGFIQDCVIATGDDCISIQTGSSRIHIKNVYCGPGHGISIGSLGKDGSAGNVRAVVVDGAVLNGTTNGLRIKSWQGGHGKVYGVLYQNVRMIGVANPIIIDQYYCDSSVPCLNQTSGVEVSGIVYRNITGTSSTAVAVRFACSDSVSCHGIVLMDVNLTSVKAKSSVSSFCENAQGIALGENSPQGCFGDEENEEERSSSSI